MSSSSSSTNGQHWPPFPLDRRNSSSSDEDGLREVLPEELEDLEMGHVDQLEPQVVLDLGEDAVAANQVNPQFNANWEPEQSSIAKKLGMYVEETAFFSPSLCFPPLLLFNDHSVAHMEVVCCPYTCTCKLHW